MNLANERPFPSSPPSLPRRMSFALTIFLYFDNVFDFNVYFDFNLPFADASRRWAPSSLDCPKSPHPLKNKRIFKFDFPSPDTGNAATAAEDDDDDEGADASGEAEAHSPSPHIDASTGGEFADANRIALPKIAVENSKIMKIEIIKSQKAGLGLQLEGFLDLADKSLTSQSQQQKQ